MNTLTCEELRAYPGATPTDRLRAHHEERAAARLEAPRLRVGRPLAARAARLHGALPLGSVIDLSRCTGRDRLDKAVNYLRAHVPRTAAWEESSLRDVAARVLSGAVRVIE
jgi:hypothetical protein